MAWSIPLIAGSITGSLNSHAQRAEKVYRIGVLGVGTAEQYATRMNAFRQELSDLGWVNQRNIAFEERWADGHYERLPTLAAELVGLRVDLILATGGSGSAQAAIKATRTIPIVFPVVADPVGEKIVPSMAHPGGNATGLTNMGSELYAKRLALLNQAVPGIKRVALITNTANPFSPEAVRISQSAGRALDIQVEPFDVRDTSDLARTFESAWRSHVQAVLAGTDIVLLSSAKELGELALKYRLPLVAGSHDAGVLVAYNVDFEDIYRRAATQVDKILKGAKPGELPIEQPSKFRLIVNLKTAKALGLTIPQSLLLRADEVIQ